jgi:hypothetical protein
MTDVDVAREVYMLGLKYLIVYLSLGSLKLSMIYRVCTESLGVL